MSLPTEGKGVTINMRAPRQLRDLIDKAAAAIGKTRTEFMLDSARRSAEEVLLDQRLFNLSDEKYEAFMRILDRPSPPTRALRNLLNEKSKWDS